MLKDAVLSGNSAMPFRVVEFIKVQDGMPKLPCGCTRALKIL